MIVAAPINVPTSQDKRVNAGLLFLSFPWCIGIASPRASNAANNITDWTGLI